MNLLDEQLQKLVEMNPAPVVQARSTNTVTARPNRSEVKEKRGQLAPFFFVFWRLLSAESTAALCKFCCCEIFKK